MRSKRRYNKKQQRIGTKKQKKNKRTRRLKRGGSGKEQWSKLRTNIRGTKGYLLKTLCSDSGVCIAFGTYKDSINRYFSNFTNFFILQSVKRIGEQSMNGMILELEYKKAGYTAHTVLKIPVRHTSDNTLYEALVGFFLNEQSLRYPSFLETYGVYNFAGDEINCFEKLIYIYGQLNKIDTELTQINKLSKFSTSSVVNIPRLISVIESIIARYKPDINGNYSYMYYLNQIKLAKLRDQIVPEKYKEKLEHYYDKIKEEQPQLIKNKNEKLRCIIKKQPFRNASEIDETTINDACENPTNYSVLIQHLKDAKTLSSMSSDTEFINNDLLYILFQVYMTLSSLSNDFTHYDLHTSNVLVYEPVDGSYIEYHYHIGETEIIFKSRYIAKIIDYGACYFGPGFNPMLYSNCKNAQSLKSFMSDNDYKRNSAKRNVSHDLRLINIIKTHLSSTVWISQIPPIIFGQGMNEGYEEYGTEENETKGYPAQINNVIDAFLYFKDTVTNQTQLTANETHYNGMTELGKLYIFDDGRNMEYVPFSELPTTVSEPVPS